MNALTGFLSHNIRPTSCPTKSKSVCACTLNSYFGHVYIINLKKRHDRLITSLQRFRQLGIRVQVINAVNGRTEPYFSDYCDYLAQPLDPERSHPLELQRNSKLITSAGAWGYLLTWRLILQDAIDNKYHSFVCFDDDVVFIKDFCTRFPTAVSQIAPDWKILQLGATQRTEARAPINRAGGYYHPLITDGSFATGVQAGIYEELLKLIDRMNCPFDSGPLRDIYLKYPKKCYVIYPNLVIADVSDSNIRGKRDMAKFAETHDWDLTNYDVQSGHGLVSVILIISKLTPSAITQLETAIRNFKDYYSKLELVIINDGNCTGLQILRKYAVDNSRFKLVNHRTAMGSRTCSQIGHKLASGSYKLVENFQSGDTAGALIASLQNGLIKQLLL